MSRKNGKRDLYDEHGHRIGYVENDEHGHGRGFGWFRILLLLAVAAFGFLYFTTPEGRDVLKRIWPPTVAAGR